MHSSLLALPLLLSFVSSAQQLPLGRVLVADTVSVVLLPLNPPPALVEPLTVPDAFKVFGLMVSVASADPSTESFVISTRVETVSGARIDLSGTVKRSPNQDWVTTIFYTGKDPVVKVLTLTVIPLLPNQAKTFQGDT